VFEPFFSTRPAGTGLGLAVVKTVAEAHGGALALESTPERGTRIGLDLPRRAEPAAPLGAECPAPTTVPLATSVGVDTREVA
jgi:two-component system sensor histidine kinase FlrB